MPEDSVETSMPEDRIPTIRTVAMPADTNPSGDIFGGWIMSQMDLAAASAASRHARGRCTTVAVDAMVFHHPVKVGDEISIFTEILKTGNTSMHIKIETWRRSRDGDHTIKVTEAVFVFVAVDRSGRPRPVQNMSS